MRANLSGLIGTGSNQLIATPILPNLLTISECCWRLRGAGLVSTNWEGIPVPPSVLPVRLMTSHISEDIGGYGSLLKGLRCHTSSGAPHWSLAATLFGGLSDSHYFWKICS